MTLTLTPPPAVAKELDTLTPAEQQARATALMLRGLESEEEEAEAYSRTSSFAEFHEGMSLAERRELDARLIEGIQEVEAGRGYTADEVLAHARETLAKRRKG